MEEHSVIIAIILLIVLITSLHYWLFQCQPNTTIGFLIRRISKVPFKLSSDGPDQLIYQLPYAPGPLCLPIVGNLYLLARHPTNPWFGFDQIRARYGDVVWLRLGRFPTVLISSLDSMREVLLTKGDHFANRPHFKRHTLYFSLDRQNALALCDWTDVHKKRRSIAHAAVIPRFGTKCFQRLSSCITEAVGKFMIKIQSSHSLRKSAINERSIILEKNFITELCCQIFFHFLLDRNLNDECNKNEENEKLKKIAQNFDLIFYDINQMYLSDFIPLLQYTNSVRKYFSFLYKSSNWVFKQIEFIVMERFEQVIQHNQTTQPIKPYENDQNIKFEDEKTCEERFLDRILLNKQYKSSTKFLDFIIDHYLDENEKSLSWSEMLYEIGDLVGGNSAVANLLFRLLGHLAINSEAQQLLYEEVKTFASSQIKSLDSESQLITIEDQHRIPLISASIMETLRLALSPIVPHLSRWDTSIQGYFVPKGTMILFNIYHLNLSTELYVNPLRFDPTRFITPEGNILKPAYFFPFSHGRRSCLGYKMVNTIISAVVANLLLHYQIIPLTNCNSELIKQFLEPKGSVALPYRPGECYNVGLVPRI